MNASLNVTRASLLTSPGCTPGAPPCPSSSTINSTKVTSTSKLVAWTKVNAVRYNLRYKKTTAKAWITVTNLTSTSYLI